MNQKYAVIKDGIVSNVIMFDPEPKENWVRSDDAAIGDLWDGKQFTRPEPAPAPPAPLSPAEEMIGRLLKSGKITAQDLNT